MQTLSGLSGRLSLRESDLNLPAGGSSEASEGNDLFCRSPKITAHRHSWAGEASPLKPFFFWQFPSKEGIKSPILMNVEIRTKKAL